MKDEEKEDEIPRIRRVNAEIMMDEFIKQVKAEGAIWASPSHSQTHPMVISHAAILKWEFDHELYATTSRGERVEVTPSMPAFYRYTGIEI